ncbi:MAG: DUF2207 domain-containing protein [Patescibacteria group bacterium]|nr:DUF2207 domain-containing protein [Patescibacteria group bacterium]
MLICLNDYQGGSLGLSFGIYKKQAVLFVGIIAIFLIGGYFISRQLSSASVQDVGQSTYSGVYNIDAQISANAQVEINGTKTGNLLHIANDYDEFRYMAADQEGLYINQMTINVHLPQPVSEGQAKQITYAVHGVDSYNMYQKDPQTLVYEGYGLAPAATFTVVAYLPKGMINFPWYSQIIYYLTNLNPYIWLIISIIFPLLALLVLFGLYLRQTSAWRLPKIKEMSDSLPSDLTPAETEVLIYGKVTSRSVAATLLDLAQRNYIYIVQKDGNFSFGKRKNMDLSQDVSGTNLRPYEKLLLAKIFTAESMKSQQEDILMRVGRHVFSKKVAQVYLDIYQSVAQKGYFLEDPVVYHKKFRNIGLWLFFIGIVGFVFGVIFSPEPKFLLAVWVMMMVIAFIIIKWSPQLPTRSAQGKGELIKWLKFRNFLTDPTELRTANSQEIFKKYLPYAISMGVEVEWAKRVVSQAFIAPEWFVCMEPIPALDDFINNLYPIIGFVSGTLSASKEPTVQ